MLWYPFQTLQSILGLLSRLLKMVGRLIDFDIWEEYTLLVGA